MARTFEGPAWKFHLTDLAGRTVTLLDRIATGREVTRLLGDSWPATMTLPADDYRVNTIYETDGHDEPFVAESIRLLYGFRRTGESPPWEIAYTGRVLQVNDVVENGVPLTHLNAWDARQQMEKLPLVDVDGNLPGSKGISFRAADGWTASTIAATAWSRAAALDDVLQLIDAGTDYGGTGSWDGVIEETAEIDITFPQGTMVADVWRTLEKYGLCDIWLQPVFDPLGRPGLLSDLSIYAEKGEDRPDAVFSWALPPRSLVGVSRLEDGFKRANVLQVYTGQGGPPVPLQSDATSIAKHGAEWAKPEFLPDQYDRAAATAYAAQELQFRRNGRTVVGISPATQRSPQPIQDYDAGDRVAGHVHRRLRKLTSGQLRVYGIPLTIGDEDALESVDSLLVSADAL